MLKLLIVSASALCVFGTTIVTHHDNEDHSKKNICHATASESNPWEAISISDNNHAHDNHVADFPYTGPTKDNGQPTKDGDEWCADNAPKDEPVDVCPNIEGDQATVPESMELKDGQCVDTVLVTPKVDPPVTTTTTTSTKTTEQPGK